VNDDDTLFIGGALTTAATLGTMHWFPWWRGHLKRVHAYILGVLAILLGQGIYMRFNRQWWRLCLIAIAGGVVVLGAYDHDATRRERAKQRIVAGGQHANGQQPTR